MNNHVFRLGGGEGGGPSNKETKLNPNLSNTIYKKHFTTLKNTKNTTLISY